MPCPSHPPRLDHSNYTWRRVLVFEQNGEAQVGLYISMQCNLSTAYYISDEYNL
jgi:hypothetical protein